MGRRASWVCRALVVVGALLPLVLGSSLEESEAEEGFGRDGARAFAGRVAAEQVDSGGDFPSSVQQPTSAPEGPAAAAHMERIVVPTLGPFIPSPEIKFPEPHSMRPPVYGEAKIPPAFDTADSGLTDVLTPPHHQYRHPKPAPGYEYEPPAFSDPPSRHPPGHQHLQIQLQSHRPRPLHPLLFGHGGSKGEDDFYLSYDGPEEDEEHAYQYLPPPGHHFPPPAPPKARPPPPPPAATSPHEDHTDLLSKKAGKAKAWKTLVAALTTLVPIGLFLAALPPNYVAVTNSTSFRTGKVEDEGGEEEYPVLGLMGRYGLEALGDPDCESRVFCEMSRMGKDPEGNVLQRVLWRIVNDVPDVLTEMIGLRTLFKAARTDSCLAFKCKDTRGVDD